MDGNATQNLKRRAEQDPEQSRPSSRQRRATSPAPSQERAHSTASIPELGLQSPVPTAAVSMPQLSFAPASIVAQPLQPAGSAAVSASSELVQATPPAISVCSRSPTLQNIPTTTPGSIVQELSIVNRSSNTTYNFGRDVFNNNCINNYVLVHKKVRGPGSKW